MSDEYDATTVLAISSIGVPPYSARGLTQTVEPIEAAKNNWRTVNGEYIDVSGPQFRKYKSTVSCNDQVPPAFASLWPGRLLTVDCAFHLSYKTDGGSPERPVVSGSSRVEGDFTIYRPQLQMRCVSFSQSEDEYGAAIGWSIELEEV